MIIEVVAVIEGGRVIMKAILKRQLKAGVAVVVAATVPVMKKMLKMMKEKEEAAEAVHQTMKIMVTDVDGTAILKDMPKRRDKDEEKDVTVTMMKKMMMTGK